MAAQETEEFDYLQYMKRVFDLPFMFSPKTNYLNPQDTESTIFHKSVAYNDITLFRDMSHLKYNSIKMTCFFTQNKWPICDFRNDKQAEIKAMFFISK